MVKTVTKGGVTSDWLASESDDGNHRYSRENVVIAASQALVDGMPLSTDGTGKMQAFAGGSGEVVSGIYFGGSITTGVGESAKGVAIVRHARIVAEKLTWKSGLSGGKVTEGLATLMTLGITTARSV